MFWQKYQVDFIVSDGIAIDSLLSDKVNFFFRFHNLYERSTILYKFVLAPVQS